MTSHTKDRAGSPFAGGLCRGRLLPVAAACLLALAAAASPFVFEGRASSAEPKLVIVASTCLVNVCPGGSQGGKTHLTAEGYKPPCKAGYSWSVDGGRIVGKGPDVVWDLTDTKPGVGGRFYDARVAVECDGRRVVSSPKRVFVWDCPQPAPTPHTAECPTVKLQCPARMKADEPASFRADVAGPSSFVPTLNWTLSAGEVVNGQGTGSVLVDAKGAGGRTIRVTVNVKDYGKRCGASCETKVAPAPASTPTPTPTPDEVERYSLRVSVVSARDQKSSVSGARVSLYLGPTLVAADEAADANGIFTRDRLAPGTYRVHVNAKRFAQGDMTVSLPRDSGRLIVFPLTPHDTPPNNSNSNIGNSDNANSNNSNDGANENTVTGGGTINGDGDANNNRRPSPPVTPTPTPDNKFLPLWLPAALVVAAALGVGAFVALKSFGIIGAAAKGAGGFAAAGATKKADQIFCTVFGPRSARPKDEFMIQVFAHLKKHAAQLGELAKGFDPSAEHFGEKPFGAEVKRGTQLFFEFEMSGLEAKRPVQTLTWYGEPASVTFAVAVPPDAEPRKVSGNVYYGVVGKNGTHVPRGQVTFMFEVVAAAAAQATPQDKLPQENTNYKKAFISYCSKDHSTVFRELQGLEVGFSLHGTQYFVDQVDIRTGDDWFKTIKTNLDEIDIFILFWSSAARDSEEVLKEVEYAMARRGGRDDAAPYFRPIPIELPLPMPLPKGLKEIHFANKIMLMRIGQETVDAQAAARASAQPDQAGQG